MPDIGRMTMNGELAASSFSCVFVSVVPGYTFRFRIAGQDSQVSYDEESLDAYTDYEIVDRLVAALKNRGSSVQ